VIIFEQFGAMRFLAAENPIKMINFAVEMTKE